uniref:Tigger transposable element-derived protein 6 n=1 Tax=Sphenodon punctatus TaxID=8508 RepID=A0A8D0L318_SPHPU
MASKRTSLSLKAKLEIIDDLESRRKSQAAICRELGLAKSTVATVWANREKIKSAIVEDSTPIQRKRIRNATHEDLDEAVYRWFKMARDNNMPVSGDALRTKAKTFAASLGIENFKCSNGWLDRFKQRHDLKFKRSVNMEVANVWLTDVLPSLLQNYNPTDIYNVCETGLFYQLLPTRTLLKSNTSGSDMKQTKQQITLLLGGNMAGSDRLTPLCVGKVENPSCFRNVKTLPVTYRYDRNAWMTGEIWTEWIRWFDEKVESQCRKVLLFTDSAPVHPKVNGLKAVAVYYLPLNATSTHGVGIVRCFKSWYRKFLLQEMIECMQSGESIKVDILQAIHLTHKAWDQVSETCFAKCFTYTGWCGHEDTQENEMPSLREECDALGLSETEMEAIEFEESQAPTRSSEDLIESATLFARDAEEVSSEEDAEGGTELGIPSLIEFKKAIATVRRFAHSLSGTEDLFALINKVETACVEKNTEEQTRSTLGIIIKREII